MKTMLKKAGILFLVLLLLTACLPFAGAEPEGREVSVLFTHDLHSHLMPAPDEEGNSYGGYARLKTVIDSQLAAHPDALILDGGDFSQGSVFQTSFCTSAAELRVMGALGVDVTTFGNHEYDNGPEGLAKMLNAAVNSGDPLPRIVETNYLPQNEGEGLDEARAAFERYGVEDYILTEKNGVWFAIFSSFGINSDEYSPTSDMTLIDRVQSAKDTIAAATAQCVEQNGAEPFVICLSHSGTSGGEGEDYDLAKEAEGIDLIVSGHTHTTLESPIEVNGTYIVSCGEYAKNLGSITFDFDPDSGKKTLLTYDLLPVNDAVTEDAGIAALVEQYKVEVERDYLSYFGMTFDQVLTQNPYAFESVGDVYATLHESPLCDVFSDAYKWAAEQATGETVDVALTAAGVIRESIPTGDVTVSDIFTAASLGTGSSDLPGGTLLSIWLDGKDLKNLLEVDASVQSIMDAAQLFCSGIEYTVNQNRMIFNKVASACIVGADGSREPIENDKLYHVVTGTYAGNMLGTVGKKSFGLLSITPRDKNGDPIDMNNLMDYCIQQPDGVELKEWYAIASYLMAMGGQMDSRYSAPDGRKVVYKSLNPVKLLQNANKFTLIALGVILLLLLVILLVLRAIVRHKKKKAAAKQ